MAMLIAAILLEEQASRRFIGQFFLEGRNSKESPGTRFVILKRRLGAHCKLVHLFPLLF